MNQEGWDKAIAAARDGRLYYHLQTLSAEELRSFSKVHATLLHLAVSHVGNEVAVRYLIAQGLDINASDQSILRHSPIITAIYHGRPEYVWLLCAAGADLRPAAFLLGQDAVYYALQHGALNSAKCLIANGMRLSPYNIHSPTVRAFERGVLRCRAAVATLMHVKQAGSLWRWDKYLLREIAFSVWSTRVEISWQ